MPKAIRNSAHRNSYLSQADEMVPNSQEEFSSSEQEPDPEVSFQQVRPPQPFQSMFMPYIEGPKMDCTVNDGLYYRFLKWCLKCENIFECKLAALSEQQQCKKVIAWSRYFGMDQYVSCCLPAEEFNWGKFKEFCKPPLNEVRAHFDLLTSFRQGNRSVDEWYNVVQAQVYLAKYPPGTARILHRDIFWFFLHDAEFVSKTMNDGNVYLDRFPASKVR